VVKCSDVPEEVNAFICRMTEMVQMEAEYIYSKTEGTSIRRH
jgi:hypothetical protein